MTVSALAMSDTIFALSTAPGRAAVAIIRLSGPQVPEILQVIAGRREFQPRKMALCALGDDAGQIDNALVVFFPEDASFSGEAMAELHLHGGRATVERCLSALSRTGLARPAAPGEFTRRALEGGRMDLVSVEALSDLIDAETEEQRRQAAALMTAGPDRVGGRWRQDLVRALSLLEASIDFADEEDAPQDVTHEVSEIVARLFSEMSAALAGSSVASRMREGFKVALVGAPNAGKSTLMNALTRKNAAITSPHAGTTRDVIEVACDFNGYPVVLQDMAGLRDTEDEVERLGVELATDVAKRADLRLFLFSEDAALSEIEDMWRSGDLRIWTKSDIYRGNEALQISALTGEGVDDLAAAVVSRLVGGARGGVAFARRRQIECLRVALQEVDAARGAAVAEMQVEHLRSGAKALNELFGDISNEELLDQVFANFCIGK